MKKLECLFFVCCAVLLCSCEEHRLDAPAETFGVTFVLDGGGAGTRATSAVGDASLSEMCLYIFNSQGILVDAVSTTQSSAFRNFEAGEYTVYAAVNCGAGVSDYSTASAIGATVRTLTSQSLSNFSMYGSASFEVPEDIECFIPVVRLVSKVELRKVSVDFSSRPSLAGSTLTIDAIYIINATGSAVLNGAVSHTASSWLNQRAHNSAGVDNLLYDAVSQGVADGSSYNTTHYYYCLQNDTTEDTHDAVWSPRHTRLVVECTLAGRKTYYPIDIVSPSGRLVRNSNYRISELTITGFGADGPDEPIPEDEAYTFSGQVLNWEGTYTINEEF